MRNIRASILLAILALALGGGIPLFGQESPNAVAASRDAATADQDNNGLLQADVVIDGKTLFSIRGVRAHPAERRAKEIETRIEAVAGNSKIDANSLTLEDHPEGTWIMADGQRILAVLNEDASIEGISPRPLAEVYRGRIGEAIEAYRRDRRPGFLLRRALYALGATLVLLVVLRFGRRIVALLRAGFERRYRARIEGFEHKAHHIIKVKQIWQILAGLLNLAYGLTIAVAVYVYLHYVLSLFPWTRAFANSMYQMAVDPLRTMGSGLVGIIPNLIFIGILVVVTRYGLKVIRAVFDSLGAGTMTWKGFDPEWALPTYRLVRLLVIAFAVVVAYPYIPGSESGAFKGVSLLIGVIFSLGSSSLIGNLVAGYSMTYRRAFRVGELVKIGEHIGNVEQIRLLVTHLRTKKNEEVIIPNSSILSSEVINYSSMANARGLILHTTVGIRYDVPWRQVEAMLLEAAARTEGLRRDPSPFVLQMELRDFSVTYEINVFCDKPHSMLAFKTALHRNILDVFNEYGIQVMVPAYEGDPDQPKIVPKERWYAAPASDDVSTNSASK
jgi:small-conductance mechanosensitive channel